MAPLPATSGIAETLPVTTGVPQAIASTRGMPNSRAARVEESECCIVQRGEVGVVDIAGIE